MMESEVAGVHLEDEEGTMSQECRQKESQRPEKARKWILPYSLRKGELAC